MKEKIYFISDAHLGQETTEKEELKEKKLLSFLEKIQNEAQVLYILGDLFDFWFEYKNYIPKEYFRVVYALKRLSLSDTKIVYLTGNHDFWLGDFLEKELDIVVSKKPLEVVHQNKKIYLIHGDGLASFDRGYRILKKFLRNSFLIWLYKQLPADLAYKIAHKSSRKSRSYTENYKDKCTEEYKKFAEEKLKSGYDCVILGHTHKPIFEKFSDGIYINLGDWMENFTYAVLENGDLKLEKFNE